MANVATPDIVLAIIILLSALMGLARGLVKEVLSLVIWGAAFVAALYFGDAVGARLGLEAGESLLRVLGFATVFIVVLIAGAIVQWLFAKLIETTGLTGTDRFLGFLFGGARGIVVCTVALIAMRPFFEDEQWWWDSRIRPQLGKLEEGVLVLMDQTTDLVMERDSPGEPTGERKGKPI